MPGTTADIWAIVAVGTVSAATMLILVVWHAPRAQERQAAAGRQMRGLAQGEQHVSSGRSAGSRLDAPVTEGTTVPSPRSPGAEDSGAEDSGAEDSRAEDSRAEERAREQATHGSSGSPMDL
jgi:hypothetical protein